MLSEERKCRESSHKARVEDVCSIIKANHGIARWDEGKEISGKVSINVFYAKTPCLNMSNQGIDNALLFME